MKLKQGQLWKTNPNTHGHDDKSLFLRIVTLERLSVSYKEHLRLSDPGGAHKKATKKRFCRFLKDATLLED